MDSWPGRWCPVKIIVSWAQTAGRPNYSSDRAGIELQLDLSEQTVSEHPESLVSEIRRAYALAEQAVREQLARHDGQHDHHQVEAQPPARDRLPSQGRAPSEPEPNRQPPRQYPRSQPNDPAGRAHNGFPRSGRELVPWSKKREESGQFPNLFKRLVGFGVAQNFPARVVDWQLEEVTEAVHAVLGEGYDDDEPEPAAGRNGYHNGRNGAAY